MSESVQDIQESNKKQESLINSRRKTLAEVKIKISLFQEDALSQLQFIY